jgi:murein DD-endopeptidase MepM/ murein hydrolase activator NlpD
MRGCWWYVAACCSVLVLSAVMASDVIARSKDDFALKGYDIKSTGLEPRYPAGFACSPLTSLYASWIDVDGTRRTEPHSGLDGGRLGDPILAPGPGAIRAVWEADWGWGREGALLIRHTPRQLNLRDRAAFYYSEFDHLRYDDIRELKVGQSISRGDLLAYVFRPGGNDEYLPEVHWEVWEIGEGADLTWSTNEHGGKYWINETARLIDPLYMLARNTPPAADGDVSIAPFIENKSYADFKGFTYILPCWRRFDGLNQEKLTPSNKG